jgi:ABC-type Fe3+-hydroxamate transport system substrate-binding protein
MPREKENNLGQSIVDQMGQKLTPPLQPQRIVSLVPSQTELLFDLGLNQEIVGITRFCIHPEEKVSRKERIGGTKDFDIEKIKSLQPDLIIGNKEENYEEGIAELRLYFPVWMSDIYTLDDAYQMMNDVGRITNRQNEARNIINEIKSGFREFSIVNSQLSIPTCAYFIWRKPYMVAASGTFIDNMLDVFGVRNVFDGLSRYPEVTAEQLEALKPDFIFLSSEPYAFTEKHIEEFKNISPDSRVMIVDGEMFSWYGSRLRHTAKYFNYLARLMASL